MIRKLILSAVIATGTLSGLTLTPGAAEANPSGYYHHHRFEVVVLCGNRWDCRGTYPNHFDAERAAVHLRRAGFRVEIREF
jgi:hypothetical protein